MDTAKKLALDALKEAMREAIQAAARHGCATTTAEVDMWVALETFLSAPAAADAPEPVALTHLLKKWKWDAYEHEAGNENAVARAFDKCHDELKAALAASQPAPEQSFVPPMMEEGSREAAMVVLERDASGKPTVWCDPEIAPIVGALIKAGIRTSWSCSGHGHRPGVIGLVDGRHLMIFNTDEDHEKAEAVFTTDINGVNDALLESQAVPEGWKLVPSEPTPHMVERAACAARVYMQVTGGNSPAVIYKAMLAAAPTPSKGEA